MAKLTQEQIQAIRKQHEKDNKCELYNDHFENAKRYGIPHAQLIIADIPYNLGNNAYASNPQWYKDGDNKNGESELANSTFFKTDEDFKIGNFFDFCTRYLKKEPKCNLLFKGIELKELKTINKITGFNKKGQVERSMISPDYARWFIEEKILDEEDIERGY